MKPESIRKLDARTKGINAAMRRVARRVALEARRYGTKIYVTRNGKIIALDPWSEPL